MKDYLFLAIMTMVVAALGLFMFLAMTGVIKLAA